MVDVADEKSPLFEQNKFHVFIHVFESHSEQEFNDISKSNPPFNVYISNGP